MVVLLSALLSFRPALRFCSGWDWLPWGFPDVGVSAVPVQCLSSFGTRGGLLPSDPPRGRLAHRTSVAEPWVIHAVPHVGSPQVKFSPRNNQGFAKTPGPFCGAGVQTLQHTLCRRLRNAPCSHFCGLSTQPGRQKRGLLANNPKGGVARKQQD